MILRLKYQFWHKNTNNNLDFQEFIEKVTKTANLALIKYKKGSEPIISSEPFLFVESFYSRIKLNASEYGIKPP